MSNRPIKVVWWDSLGREFRGAVREVEGAMLIVDCDDGDRRAVDVTRLHQEDLDLILESLSKPPRRSMSRRA